MVGVKVAGFSETCTYSENGIARILGPPGYHESQKVQKPFYSKQCSCCVQKFLCSVGD